MQEKLLPTVLSGTSGGALVASLVCVRTDEELLEVLTPKLSEYLNAVDESLWTYIRRFTREGIFFDADRWIQKFEWITKGPTTFLEAYQRTGRVLNITVIPEGSLSPPLLLNFKNSPNVVIYSAVLASASIPALSQAGELIIKRKDGTLEPYHLIGKRWRDGSFKTDIPARPLHRLFNVNYTIVSQVNPHISLFFYENRGSSGNPSLHRQGQGW